MCIEATEWLMLALHLRLKTYVSSFSCSRGSQETKRAIMTEKYAPGQRNNFMSREEGEGGCRRRLLGGKMAEEM